MYGPNRAPNLSSLISYRLNHFNDILKESNRQLSFIETYLSFIMLNLREKRNQSFDNDFRDGEAIDIAANFMKQEFENLREDFIALKKDLNSLQKCKVLVKLLNQMMIFLSLFFISAE